MTTSQYKSPKWLLIDDVRHYPVDEIARNFWDGLRALKSTAYDGLLIDYQLDMQPSIPNGLDVLKMAALHDVLPNLISVVSTHPVGRKRIAAFLDQNGYVYRNEEMDLGYVVLDNYWERLSTTERAKRSVCVHMEALKNDRR